MENEKKIYMSGPISGYDMNERRKHSVKRRSSFMNQAWKW